VKRETAFRLFYVWRFAFFVFLAAVAAACSGRGAPPDRASAPAATEWFTDKAKETGLDFVHFNGMSGESYYPEIMPPGVALFDYDNDGDLDVLITVNNGPARLLRNDGGNRNNMLRVRTIGTTSNRDGIGARVDVVVHGGASLWQIVKTGSSYASQSELPLTFGLGRATDVDGIKVRWPSGRVDSVGTLKANQLITIKEGTGVVNAAAINRR
jgi:hypothetical protein